MGCFLGCFKPPEDRKRRRSPRRSPSRERRVSESCQNPIPSAKQISPNPCAPALLPPEEEVAVAAALLPEKKKENVEKGNAGGGGGRKKKVTFDLNVKTYEQVPSDDGPDSEDDEELGEIDGEEKPVKGEKDESHPNSGTFPSNHRYENCESSDDDHGGESGEDEDEFDGDFEIGIQGNEEEDSYDSFFSLPLDQERQGLREEFSSPELDSASAPLLSGGTRDRSQFVHSVLNPVENLSQWKEIKVRPAPAKNPDKQNLGDELENRPASIAEPEIKAKKKPQVPKQEVSVDASLSNWLPSSETPPQASNSQLSNSSFSRDDRPILGALTIDDIKQSAMDSSSRRSSPSKSPPADEIPILGTVGTYWSCENPGEDAAAAAASSSRPPSSRLAKGIPNTTSKYREDKAVNWHTTPFEVRLERALRHGDAAA